MFFFMMLNLTLNALSTLIAMKVASVSKSDELRTQGKRVSIPAGKLATDRTAASTKNASP